MKHHSDSPLSWSDHVRTYLDRRNGNVGLLRYETLLVSPEHHLAEAIATMTGAPADKERVADAVRRYSFDRQSGRKPGEEDRSSFLRKGQAGDWINHFTPEAAEILDAHCGDMMLRLGYIENRNWVKQCS